MRPDPAGQIWPAGFYMETTMIALTEGIQLFSGVFFDYNNPDESDLGIEDIAHALAHVCRFAGHVSHFYSVAQHCVNTSFIVPPEHALTALLHDTAEAFTNDLPTPLKTAVPAFKDLEVSIEASMSRRFGFEFPLPHAVRLADLQMLKAEKEALKPHASGEWEVLIGVHAPDDGLISLASWDPAIAKTIFLERYRELTRA